jgi:DNA-binding response OmpR family regulator
MSTVLVVEDNQTLAERLESWLSKHYEVSVVSTGEQALATLTTNSFDIIVLDLGLPDMPGQDVCNQIRLKGIKTPIMVLTANSDVATKVDVLDMGADDYLLKPFYVGELQARLRALLRRSQIVHHGNILRVSDLVLDPTRRQVSRAGKLIEIRRKEFDILEYLMQNRGTVVTRSMIISNSWEAGADRWNNTVDVHIKYLRDKIDRPFKQKLIKTAYGVGYMIDDAP